DPADRTRRRGELGRAGDTDRDLLDARPVAGAREAPQRGRDREVDVAVDVAQLDDGRAALADGLRLHHSDRRSPALADGGRGPERVGVSEQVLLQLRAEDADRLAVLDVEGRDEASLADPEAGHVLVLGARADDLADALARLEAHLLVEELEGDDAHQTPHLLPDEESVVVGQAAREA